MTRRPGERPTPSEERAAGVRAGYRARLEAAGTGRPHKAAGSRSACRSVQPAGNRSTVLRWGSRPGPRRRRPWNSSREHLWNDHPRPHGVGIAHQAPRGAFRAPVPPRRNVWHRCALFASRAGLSHALGDASGRCGSASTVARCTKRVGLPRPSDSVRRLLRCRCSGFFGAEPDRCRGGTAGWRGSSVHRRRAPIRKARYRGVPARARLLSRPGAA